MSATDPMFDPSNSNLQIGLEVEWPELLGSDKRYVNRGGRSEGLQNAVDGLPARLDANPTWDGTVGLEIVSGILDLEDAPYWYADVLDYVRGEYSTDYQPVGLLRGGSTAGLHMHLSPLTEEDAKALAAMSDEPWMHVLFCSSVASEGGEVAWPVFRGGQYCQLGYGRGHYDVVNPCGGSHYEWRLPEPLCEEHLEIVVEFLRAFEQSPAEAREYAQRVLDRGDDRITALKRAEAVGMDIETVPMVSREPSENDPERFFDTVRDSWRLPEIYRIEMEGNEYYVFESEFQGEFAAEGITFTEDDVLWADSLEPLPENEERFDVLRAYQRRSANDLRETQATDELKKILKKKKGKL